MTDAPLPSTPAQTVGPYLSIGMTWERGEYVVADDSPGSFWIRGRLLDGAGDPVPDGLIETWQADQDGGFAHAKPDSAGEGFRGFGRSLTEADGTYAIHTRKPGPVSDGEGGMQAPHLDVSVFARGLLHRVVMRFYFGDEKQANGRDAVLSSLPDEARGTLIAAPDGAGGYTLDIRLQGDHETVFFTV